LIVAICCFADPYNLIRQAKQILYYMYFTKDKAEILRRKVTYPRLHILALFAKKK
jgi:hypothetical protein